MAAFALFKGSFTSNVCQQQLETWVLADCIGTCCRAARRRCACILRVWSPCTDIGRFSCNSTSRSLFCSHEKYSSHDIAVCAEPSHAHRKQTHAHWTSKRHVVCLFVCLRVHKPVADHTDLLDCLISRLCRAYPLLEAFLR